MTTTYATYATYVTHQAEYQVRVSPFGLTKQAYLVSIFSKKVDENGKFGFETLPCLEFQATKLFVGSNNHIVVLCVDNKTTQSLVQQMPRHPSHRPPLAPPIPLVCNNNQRCQQLYVSVDTHIRMFKCLAPIDKLISHTNTDAVYASLVDLAGNVYLIHENVVLRKPPVLADYEYYGWYYRHMQLSERSVACWLACWHNLADVLAYTSCIVGTNER